MRHAFLFLVLTTTLIFAQTDFMAQGDAAYKAFDDKGALEFYTKAFDADQNCEAAWKMSRAHVNLGEKAEKQEDQEKHYLKAEELAKKAVELCPNSSNAHLYVSVAVGRVALISGKKKQVELSATVKEEAMKALELDPQNDVAHHVLARWHRKVANLSGIQKTFAKVLFGGLPDASNEKAVEHFQKAIEIAPNGINHHLELGITHQEMKNWAAAKTEYDKVLELPIDDSDDADHKKEAQKRLDEIAKKL